MGSTYSWVSQLCLCRHRIGVVTELYPHRRWDQSSTFFVCGLHSTHSSYMLGVLGKGFRGTLRSFRRAVLLTKLLPGSADLVVSKVISNCS